MGKGQRSREARAGKREELKKIAAKKKLQQKIKKIVGISLGAVAAAAIVGVVAYNAIASTGYFLRNTVAMKSENYKVDNAMMTYYVKNQYYSFANQYGDYLSMYGLDTSKSLKSQKYGDGTWLDYFLSLAKQQAKETLLCAEKAKAEGYELSQEDNADIEATMKSFVTEAETYKIDIDTYYSQVFGTGLKEDDVRRAVTLSKLASKYYTDFNESLKYTDEDFNKHFSENESSYLKADYISYSVPGDTEEQIKANAKTYQSAKSTKEFLDLLEKDYKEQYTADAVESNSVADATKLTAEQLSEVESKVETALSNAKATSNKPAKDSEDKFLLWLFEDGRKVNEIYTVETQADEEKDTKYSCTVNIVERTSYCDDYKAAKARHIMFTEDKYETLDAAKAKAEEVLNKYKESASEEKFIELAKEYSEDTTTAENGGLYEAITKDTAAWPESLSNWCYAEGRKAGDVDLIQTDSGYHLVYYVGEGEIVWKIEAESTMMNEDYEELIETLGKEFSLTQNDNKMKSIKA